MLHAMADAGEVEILATIVSSRYEWSAPAVDVINTHSGRPELPIGVAKGDGASTERGSRFASALSREFPHRVRSNDDAPDAVDAYRRILASQPDASVTIVTVGYLTNVSNLLRSGRDEHSRLSGKELVARKVTHYVAMGSRYPADLDPTAWGNFKPDPMATMHVVAEWPTITFTNRRRLRDLPGNRGPAWEPRHRWTRPRGAPTSTTSGEQHRIGTCRPDRRAGGGARHRISLAARDEGL